VQLHATIRITPQYPVRPPRFALTLTGADVDTEPLGEVQAMLQTFETEVNVHWDELVYDARSRLYVLALQLRRLQMMFDMYVQVQQSTDSKGAMIGKLFERGRRGRARAVPTVYRTDQRLFTHRTSQG
jgi:hypothetical protein